MTPADVIAAARACLGTPFRHQGRLPGIGLDCGGLIVAVCQALGLEYQDMAGYGRRPGGGAMELLLDSQSCIARIQPSQAEIGDLLLMRFRTDPQHLALRTDVGIIHAFEEAGAVVEHGLDDVWRRRIVRAYTWVGLHE